MNHHRYSLLLLCLILPFAALAQQAAPPTNYLDVTARLRQQGIEPARINWNHIDDLCNSMRGGDDSAFNSCRYNKVMDSVAYDNDSGGCNTEANASINSNASVTTATNNNGTVTTVTPGAPSGATVANNKQTVFNQCMQARGWTDPQHWEMGRNKK